MHHLFDVSSLEDAHGKESKFGAIFKHLSGEWKGELEGKSSILGKN